MVTAAVPARDQSLVLAELVPPRTVDGLECARVVFAVVGVVAAVERQQGQAVPGRLGRGDAALEVERKRLAIARARGVSAAAVVGSEQLARTLLLAEHHQSPPLAELDEALRLAGHVDRVRREPRDQLVRSSTGCLGQTSDVERR